MTLARWQGSVVDDSGNIVAGAQIFVSSEATGNLVPIFSDKAGNDSESNPFVTDAEGFGAFYVPDGSYKITARSGEFERIFRHVDLVAFKPSFSQAFEGTGAQTDFTLSEDLGTDSGALIITVNDILQDPATYTVNGTALAFSSAPDAPLDSPPTDNILVRRL